MNDYRLQIGEDCFSGHPAPFQTTLDKTPTRTQKRTLKSPQPRYRTAWLSACPTPTRGGPGADPAGTAPALDADESPERTPPALLQPRPRGSWQGDTAPSAPRQPRWQTDTAPPGVRAGKWHQHQNRGDVGGSRRRSNCGGQIQLGHGVAPAPTTLPAQGSRPGTSSQTGGSPDHPDGIAGKPGRRNTAARQERAQAAAFTPVRVQRWHGSPGAVPSRWPCPPGQCSRSSPSTNVSPSCSYDSLRFPSPGNSQQRFNLILSSVLQT